MKKISENTGRIRTFFSRGDFGTGDEWNTQHYLTA